MSDFDEFRVSLSPDLHTPGNWMVNLDECPVAGLAGVNESVKPKVTRDQLISLRDRHGWPDSAKLKEIGDSVWDSIMIPDLKAALFASLSLMNTTHRGVRLVFSIIGNEPEPAGPNQIRLQELPLEVLRVDNYSFLATNSQTPVSRSLRFKPDRDPFKLVPPLRILVVVATPTGRPPANMQEEQEIIRQALSGLTDSGAVELDFCQPPTRPELANRLSRGYHVLHFVGHGAFEPGGADPSQRPFLCLEREDGKADLIDAETFALQVRNLGVQLVIMTACSSASPVPDETNYHARAFDGMAQRLMSDDTGVGAVVAMQFDLESPAAVTFSKAFYNNLLFPGLTLDEVVTRCRLALVTKMDAGHRCWVTPVVYWRFKNGQVFDLADSTGYLDDGTRILITGLQAQIQVFQKLIANIKKKMPDPTTEVQQVLESTLAEYQQSADDLQQQINEALGETLRLRGGKIKPGEVIQCRLTLRLRTPAKVGNTAVRVLFPQDKLQVQATASGADTPGVLLMMAQPAPGELRLQLSNLSQGVQWDPKEFEIGLLGFQVQAGVTDPFVEIMIDRGKMERNGILTPMQTLNALLYVN